ncbi:45124_t:CDS:2 [Gigaspora margarita]|uniref:45124_t:CDS:1 n=1 Tax=Gigaspora margarita TaxID=4874 RepID=A0ABN7UGA0_GIGMA|nr:45124_t:CDS:2 [Gigaspora margarita]
MFFVASQKPELTEYYQQLVKQAQKELESSEPYSITFISKTSDQEKLKTREGKREYGSTYTYKSAS